MRHVGVRDTAPHVCRIHERVAAEFRRIHEQSVIQHGRRRNPTRRVSRQQDRPRHGAPRRRQITPRAHIGDRLIHICFIGDLTGTRRCRQVRSACECFRPADRLRTVQMHDRAVIRLGRQRRIYVLQRYRLRRQLRPRRSSPCRQVRGRCGRHHPVLRFHLPRSQLIHHRVVRARRCRSCIRR
jgi:hypothetical protein